MSFFFAALSIINGLRGYTYTAHARKRLNLDKNGAARLLRHNLLNRDSFAPTDG
jgi:hypothetical protein